MSNEFHLGFVAVFSRPLNRARIQAAVAVWLDLFEKVEQVVDGQIATLAVSEPGDLMWHPALQFRVVEGDQFSWVYLNQDSRVIETTGQPNGEEVSLCLKVLTELPDIQEIVPDHDERRLDQLEKEGIL